MNEKPGSAAAVLPHIMLLANAGSGKTYTLTKRTIALLALGVEPRRIAGLTFTKKAAGEFLEKVFLRLADAALDPDEVQRLDGEVREIAGEQLAISLDARRCRELLGAIVAQLGELGFGTIDGLFAKLARAFPLEAGLPGDFSVLDEAGQLAIRREALGELFAAAAANPESLDTLIDLVRRQSRTNAERAVFDSLESLVASLHGAFLATPRGVSWGDGKKIWSADPAPRHGLAAAVDAFREAALAAAPALDPEAVTILEGRCSELRSLVPGQTLSRPAKDFVKSKLAGEAKSGSLQMTKKKVGHIPLTPAVDAARRELLRVLWWREISHLLERSRALHEVLESFDRIYQGMVRSRGQLTFLDVAHVLAEQAGAPDWVALAGFRLDGKFDHWLLDEFQDTSRLQWDVIRPLIDEVLQDESRARSLFYVGDTKQAIYGWRGGDARLFFEISNHYNRHRKLILPQELPDSQRSCAQIIEAVNAVFGSLDTSVAGLMGWPEQTVLNWQKAWVRHSVAPRNAGLQGSFVWKRVESQNEPREAGEDDSEAGGEEDLAVRPQDREILSLLRDLEPWNAGHTCAVLKRDNKSVGALAALLQAEGIPVAVEGQTNPCMDNPLGRAIHAALRVLGSPSDSLAALVLEGFPLGGRLLAEGMDAFRATALRILLDEGFAPLVLHWLAMADLEGEEFLRERGERIRSVAAQFDAQAGPDHGPLEFASCMESYRAQESEAPGTIRLMTVHQAKGLTFDHCIVSGLDEMVRDRLTGTLQLGGGIPPRWGMLWPGKEWTDVDPTLRGERERMLADAAYESLCTVYVAFTRARIGLVVLTDALKPSSNAKTLDRLLSHAFGGRDCEA